LAAGDLYWQLRAFTFAEYAVALSVISLATLDLVAPLRTVACTDLR